MRGVVSRWRARRERWSRLWALGDCPDCGHPWAEHRGTGHDLDGMCGECAYEFDHEQRQTDAPGCRAPCPVLDEFGQGTAD